jgi:hypothetical protein
MEIEGSLPTLNYPCCLQKYGFAAFFPTAAQQLDTKVCCYIARLLHVSAILGQIFDKEITTLANHATVHLRIYGIISQCCDFFVEYLPQHGRKRPKHVGGLLYTFVCNFSSVFGILNPELAWQGQRSARRLFSPANWTSIKEATSKVLHSEHSCVRCCNVGTAESRPEIPGKV